MTPTATGRSSVADEMLDLTRLRVLLVEDNELDARVMLRTLREAAETRFDVRHERSMRDAVIALQEQGFDCILIDLTLPDTFGLEVLEAIANEAPATPVVVLTGLEDPRLAVEAVEHGAHDVLPKSRVDGDVVARSIRYAVTRHHSETDLRATTEQLRVANDRNRIAQDLHDTVIQQLFATGMSLQALTARIGEEEVRQSILESVDQIDVAIRELRQTIFDLHLEPESPVGDEIDRVIEQQTGALGFEPSVTRQGLAGLRSSLRSDVAAVVREALSNVARHADASVVAIRVVVDGPDLIVEISDNGVGIDSTDAPTSALRGHGLTNLRHRAEAHGGRAEIASGAEGGTTVRWVVPVG